MSHINRIKEAFKRLYESRKQVIQYWQKTPSTKIIMINTAVYFVWKLDLIPEQWLVKHLSAERYNMQGGRIHTLITYSFSHFGIFGLLFDALMLGWMGRAIQSNVGNKYVYWLYGLGALFGGFTIVTFQRPSKYIQPQVGPDSCLAAYLTFLAMLNPRNTFYFFMFPVQAWALVAAFGFYSLLFDPHKKVFAGITAGLTVHQMMRVGFL